MQRRILRKGQLNLLDGPKCEKYRNIHAFQRVSKRANYCTETWRMYTSNTSVFAEIGVSTLHNQQARLSCKFPIIIFSKIFCNMFPTILILKTLERLITCGGRRVAYHFLIFGSELPEGIQVSEKFPPEFSNWHGGLHKEDISGTTYSSLGPIERSRGTCPTLTSDQGNELLVATHCKSIVDMKS